MHLSSPTDSDNTGDARELIGNVLNSDVVVLFQSSGVLSSTRCLLELYTAATAGIPIVSLVCSGKGYDSTATEDHLLHLDTRLPALNPTAIGELESYDAVVERVSHVLWTCIPNVISVQLNSQGSKNVISAAVADLINAMQRARAISISPDSEASWRDARDGAAFVSIVAKSPALRGTQRGRMLHRFARGDELATELAELKAKLKAKDADARAEAEEHAVLVAALREMLDAKDADIAALVAERVVGGSRR